MSQPSRDDNWPENQADFHDRQRLVAWLTEPANYPEPTTEVTLRETHISQVFLTDQYAYKLKKPVRYDFLDYSTPDARRQACAEEVRLNAPLAPQVYLGVRAITLSTEGTLAIDGPGEPIDWLVQMRRLDERDTLESRLRDDRLREADVATLVARLVDFYRHVPRVPVDAETYRREIERHVRANGAELSDRRHGLPVERVHRVLGAQLRSLVLRPEWFDQRVASQAIVDGHGDLRPEHIYLTPEPLIIDGIEFNAEFRRLDIADELSFLEMECERLGRHDIGQPIRDRTLMELGQAVPPDLLAFYRSYRACVRAKVAVLRESQQAAVERSQSLWLAEDYLQLAEEELSHLPPPFLIVIRGLSGTGKSSLARWLGERLQIPVISTDRVRQELFGPGGMWSDYAANRYELANRQRIYDEQRSRARFHLETGQSVILDGTFLTANQRLAAVDLAKAVGIPFLLVQVHCPAEIASERIRQRIGDASEAQPELYALQASEEEPDVEGLISCTIDSRQSISIMGEQLIAVLRKKAAGVPE